MRIPDALRTGPLPDPERGKQEGIERVALAAARLDEGWRDRMLEAVRACALDLPDLICDDVWEYAQPADRPPAWPKAKALGGVMQRAAREKLIERTESGRASIRSHNSPKPVWRSLIFDPLHGLQEAA